MVTIRIRDTGSQVTITTSRKWQRHSSPVSPIKFNAKAFPKPSLNLFASGSSMASSRKGSHSSRRLSLQSTRSAGCPSERHFVSWRPQGSSQRAFTRGAVVTGLSLEQIQELFDLRVVLECELLRWALLHMKAEHLKVAEAILPELEAAYLAQDVLRWGGGVELGVSSKPLPFSQQGSNVGCGRKCEPTN